MHVFKKTRSNLFLNIFIMLDFTIQKVIDHLKLVGKWKVLQVEINKNPKTLFWKNK